MDIKLLKHPVRKPNVMEKRINLSAGRKVRNEKLENVFIQELH